MIKKSVSGSHFKVMGKRCLFTGIALVMLGSTPLGSTGCAGEETDSQISNAVTFGATLLINPADISKVIISAIQAPANRESFVKGLNEKTFWTINNAAQAQGITPYNVIVFNLAQSYDHQLNDVVYMDTFTHEGLTFGVWAFGSGWFENKGDGGYLNWAMYGWHDHDEGQGAKRVNFYRP